MAHMAEIPDAVRDSPDAVSDAADAVRDAADAVNEALTAVLRWASRAEVRRARAGTAGAGLSPTDMYLLGAIATRGPVRVSDLARWQGVDKSTVTPQVRRIEARGLVRRAPDPQDRRAWLFTATERGLEVQRELGEGGAAVVRAILATWSRADRETFAGLLTRFSTALDERPSSAPVVG